MPQLTKGDRVRLTFEGVTANVTQYGAAGFMLDGGMVERAFTENELAAAKVEVLKPPFKRDDVVRLRDGTRAAVIAVDEDLGRAWVRTFPDKELLTPINTIVEFGKMDRAE